MGIIELGVLAVSILAAAGYLSTSIVIVPQKK